MFILCHFFLVLIDPSSTNNDSLQVLSLMASKQDRVYARGHSKSVAPSAPLFIGSDDEHDPEYVPPDTATPARATCATKATPKKVASGVVSASQSDEERILTDTPSGLATHEEEASGSLGVLWSVKSYGFREVPAPARAAQSTSSDKVVKPDSTPGSPTGALTSVADQPNRWCVDGQYHVY